MMLHRAFIETLCTAVTVQDVADFSEKIYIEKLPSAVHRCTKAYRCIGADAGDSSAAWMEEEHMSRERSKELSEYRLWSLDRSLWRQDPGGVTATRIDPDLEAAGEEVTTVNGVDDVDGVDDGLPKYWFVARSRKRSRRA